MSTQKPERWLQRRCCVLSRLWFGQSGIYGFVCFSFDQEAVFSEVEVKG